MTLAPPKREVARVPVATPARIAPLPNLPLFHKLAGRRVVVAGGSQGAVWKTELVAATGANVVVLAGSEIAARLYDAVAAQPVSGSVVVHARAWGPTDLNGAALALADIADEAEAHRFIAAAHEAGALVNIIDRTEHCDVTFGTIVNRAPVVVAISTDGGAPMLGQSIRARMESILPLGLSAWAKAAQSWRPLLKERVKSFQDRRRFWERFTERAWQNVDRAPTVADRDALFGGAAAAPRVGKVTLVGAGPGDPELLTLKAVRALQTADVILYDDLVGPEVLELARREARRVAVGKTGHGPSCSQSDICREIVALAQTGESVVRLKGGDPLIFGRATEEIDACRAARVEVSIIPGISAAQGAAASLGISLTERLHARRLQLVTGHGADGKLPSDIEWAAIADPVTTTVLYMPRGTLTQFVERALAEGLDPVTPAVAVASATRGDQAQVAGTVRDLPALAACLPQGAPVTVIIGKVARERARAPADLSAFSKVSEAA